MENKNKEYYVYKHVFPNNKIYIGVTCQEPEDRWDKGRGYIEQRSMTKAILEYGWNNIKHEILYKGLTKEEAEQKEIELIAYYKSNNKEYGYNIQSGGNLVNQPHTENNSDEIMVFAFHTFPNQKIIHINKKRCGADMLIIDVDEWIEASKKLTPNTFRLYLYLASNKDGFNLALSRKDVISKFDINKSSYTRGVEELIRNGYLKNRYGNIYDFYTSINSIN